MESNYSSMEEAINSAGIVIFDPDVVGVENVAASYYTHDQAILEAPKVRALVHNLNVMMDVSILGIQSKMPSQETPLSYLRKPVLIVSTDSRASRIRIWNMLKRRHHYHNVELLIDARSGWDVTRVFTCFLSEPEECERYESSMQSEGQRIPCSARAVAYNSIGVGSTVAAMVKSYSVGDEIPYHVMWDYKTWTSVIQHR